MTEEIHVGDIGTKFLVTIKEGTSVVDISSATTKEIIFLKPEAASGTVEVAEFETDGTDGKIYYLSGTSFLDTAGEWTIQAHVAIGTDEWRSSFGTFVVYDNLPVT